MANGPDDALPTWPVLPGSPVAALDDLARDVAHHLSTPSALVSLVCRSGVVTPGAYGLDDIVGEDRVIPLRLSMCQLVVRTGQAQVIADLAVHEGAQQLPDVLATGFRSYLGVPVHGADGEVIGALCASDRETRSWSEADVRWRAARAWQASVLVQAQARELAIDELDDRIAAQDAAQAKRSRTAEDQVTRDADEGIRDLPVRRVREQRPPADDPDGLAAAVARACAESLGTAHTAIVLMAGERVVHVLDPAGQVPMSADPHLPEELATVTRMGISSYTRSTSAHDDGSGAWLSTDGQLRRALIPVPLHDLHGMGVLRLEWLPGAEVSAEQLRSLPELAGYLSPRLARALLARQAASRPAPDDPPVVPS